MMQNLNQNDLRGLVRISKFAGERFDLVQAGGGNSSVKFSDGKMAIKASGFALSDVDLTNGYAVLENNSVLEILKCSDVVNQADKNNRDEIIKSLIEKENLTKDIRPSIEIFLHSLLGKYILHTHPISANNILCSYDWKEIIAKIFTNEDYFITVPYATPGIELALSLQENVTKFLRQNNRLPEIIFMQNHGIIISKSEADEVIFLTNKVVQKIENYLNVNYDFYKTTNQISALINQIGDTNLISYFSEDKTINEILINDRKIFNQLPTCPDVLVFCGVAPCVIKNLQDKNSITNFKTKYYQLPKVVIYQEQIFFIAKNIFKAKEIEEVFKFHLLVLKNLIGKANILAPEEISYLLNWEAEKFRQNIKH